MGWWGGGGWCWMVVHSACDVWWCVEGWGLGGGGAGLGESWCVMVCGVGGVKLEAKAKDCRLLQGPRTELLSVQKILHALRHHSDCVTRITNYRRNGEKCAPFHLSHPLHASLACPTGEK